MPDTGGKTRLAEERGNKLRKQSLTELLRKPGSETSDKKGGNHATPAVNIGITTTMYPVQGHFNLLSLLKVHVHEY